jgi:hypothetical protein
MGLRRPCRLRSDSGDLKKDAIFDYERSCRYVLYMSMCMVWVKWAYLCMNRCCNCAQMRDIQKKKFKRTHTCAYSLKNRAAYELRNLSF